MRRHIVILCSLAVASLSAAAFYAHSIRRLDTHGEALTHLYRSTCTVPAGDYVPSDCLEPVPITLAAASHPELRLFVSGDRRALARISPLAHTLESGALLGDHHFAHEQGPIADGRREMTIAVDARRVPERVQPGARVDVFAGRAQGPAAWVLRDATVVAVNGARWPNPGPVERLTLSIPSERAAELAGQEPAFVVALAGLRRPALPVTPSDDGQ